MLHVYNIEFKEISKANDNCVEKLGLDVENFDPNNFDSALKGADFSTSCAEDYPLKVFEYGGTTPGLSDTRVVRFDDPFTGPTYFVASRYRDYLWIVNELATIFSNLPFIEIATKPSEFGKPMSLEELDDIIEETGSGLFEDLCQMVKQKGFDIIKLTDRQDDIPPSAVIGREGSHAGIEVELSNGPHGLQWEYRG